MSKKQIKQSVTATLLALALAFFAADHKTAMAVANDDYPAPFHEVEPVMAVDGDGGQDKPAAPQDKSAQEKPAEEVYKNIQVLKGVPASRLMPAMSFFTKSLGVKCDHCHVPREFDKDDKPAKLTARKMYEIVRVSNRELGGDRVTCFTCHRGNVRPEPPPDSWRAQAEEMMKKAEEDKRPAEQVYKNIQTLKGVPAGRWMIIMQMFSKSLGVDCNHCHVQGAFEKDDKPAKQTARKMLHMVGVISREVLKGPTNINCYTCHKGQVQPVSFPPQPQKTQ